MMKKKQLIYVICGLSFLQLTSCSVEPDTTDTSEPKIKWIITNDDTGAKTNATGNADLSFDTGTHLSISACAQDVESGIQEWSYDTKYELSCMITSGGMENVITPIDTTETNTTSVPLNSDGKAQTLACKTFKIHLEGCPEGSTTTKNMRTIKFCAKNYANLEDCGTLTIKAR